MDTPFFRRGACPVALSVRLRARYALADPLDVGLEALEAAPYTAIRHPEDTTS